MKKLLLTLIAIFMVASVFANNVIISEENEIGFDKATLPEKFNYFDDLGFSTYSKTYKDGGCDMWKLLARLWEYNHAYDTGIDNLRLDVSDFDNSYYETYAQFHIKNLQFFNGPKIQGSDKIPGYVTKFKHAYIYGSMNAETHEYIKQQIYGGYGVSIWIDMYSYFLQDKAYYAPESYGDKKIWGLNIVGWDDSYPKENFKITPSGDGAFLTQGVGGDGLYWVSYYTIDYRDYYVTRYVDKSFKEYTSRKANFDIFDDNSHKTTIKNKYGKVLFNCDKDGTLYGLQFNTFYYNSYSTSQYCKYKIDSYKVFLNDALIEEKAINNNMTGDGKIQYYEYYKDYELIDLNNPVSYKVGDVISVEIEYNSELINLIEPWSYDKEDDRVAAGGRKQTSYFRNSLDAEWELYEYNKGSKYEPNIYYAQIPLSLLVDEDEKAQKIEFIKDEVNVDVYGKAQLQWKFTPNDTTDQEVSFSSSDLSVVMVNDFGEIKGLKKGVATITITHDRTGLTDTCKVNVLSNKIRVIDVTLDKSDITLKFGQSYKLKAKVSPNDAYNKNVKWYTSNTEVATVDQNGNVSGYGEGEATITVETEESSFKATCKVKVVKVPVTGITLDKYNTIINVGKTIAINETILPEDASYKTVTWESNDKSVATVDQTGLVTGIKPGTATIKVISTDNPEIFSTCVVGVTGDDIISVTNVKVTQNVSLNVGKTSKLSASVYPSNASVKTVTWKSSNPYIATVDKTGKVIAVAPGVATITVTTDGTNKYGKQLSANCIVTVNLIPVTSITLNKTSFTLYSGRSFTLKATVAPSNASIKTLKWKSFNPSIASVDSEGVITAHKPGTVKISCSANDGSGVNAECTVKIIEPVTSITLSKTNLNMKTGKTFKLVATVLPENANYKKVTWASSDPSVAKISTTGIITALKAGTCKITATSKDGTKITAECNITVTESVKITLNKERFSLFKGKTFKLIATVTNADIKKVTWSSEDPSIASVTSTGVVQGVSVGRTYITATSVADPTIKVSCRVTIKE